jgi:hypothetical protein
VDVAVEDDVILIGATQNGTGSVHVFTRNGSGWIERSTLRPSDGWTLLAFGGSVGLSGSTAVIGAAYQAKSAYVYELKLTENQRPVANAGPDRTAECAGPGRADVTLDGSGSTDADSTPGTNDDVASFEWFEDDSLLGSGETITVPLSLGPHEIVLKVTDKAGESATDWVTVTVADTMPPTVSVSASPSSLWPPDHRMVPVNIAVVAADVCDVVPSIVLQSVASTEPQGGSRNGSGRKASDIQSAEIGTADYFVLLRAEREGSGPGRTYTVTYRATDSAGNGGVGVVEVEVPHDQRVGSRSAVKSASASQIPAF